MSPLGRAAGHGAERRQRGPAGRAPDAARPRPAHRPEPPLPALDVRPRPLPLPDPERLVRRRRGERDRARRGARPARLRSRPRPLPSGRRHAPRAGRALPAPRRPPRGRRTGGGGLPALPVPRLEVRRRVRRVRRDPLRRREADPAEGPRPHVPDPRAQPHDLGLVPRAGRRAVLRGARGARVPRSGVVADPRAHLRDPRVGAGHGGEQRRLLALPLRARLRRHPRGRVHHRGHLQEDDRRGRQLRPRGLRPRPGRAPGARAT